MTGGWLVYALVVGALVSVAAAAIDEIFRARRLPTRAVWATSMLAMLVVVALAVRSGPRSVPVGFVRSLTVVPGPAASGRSIGLLALFGDVRALVQATLEGGMATISGWIPAWVAGAALRLWIMSALLGLATLAMVHLRLRRARRAWPSAELHGRQVRVAPSVGPAVVGLAQPEIVVPRWLLNRSADEQRLVLSHEEEHVRAHDHLLLGAASLAVALMPWHPAAWWTLSRLRLALELDCDARVLRRGTHARSYGEMLIDLAGQCSGFRVGATALADKKTHLERRLLAMRPITKRFTLVRATILGAAAALSLAAACEARVPTSAEIQAMDVASAERTAAKTGLLEASHGASTVFYVNDVKVSAAEAHAIPPNDIATINVEKSAADAIVRIRTLAAAANGMKYRAGGPAGAVLTESEAKAKRLHEKMALDHSSFSGVILIDGVRADAAALHQLDPKDIISIEVTKGAAATALLNDPAAKDGIIKVTTSGRRTKG